MSTRSCIARLTGEHAFAGVYHHWDGYPTALGATLWNLYRAAFNRDLERMLTILIDDHPAGWSTINNADFTLPAGYEETKYRKKRNGNDDYSKPIPHGPICYCHGGRHEEASPVTEADDCGMEWAYVFDVDRRGLLVFERLYESSGSHMVGMFGMGAPGNQRWALAADIDLDGDEPDWSKINARNYARTHQARRTGRRKANGTARKSPSPA
jgi:hypothetical protein